MALTIRKLSSKHDAYRTACTQKRDSAIDTAQSRGSLEQAIAQQNDRPSCGFQQSGQLHIMHVGARESLVSFTLSATVAGG